MLNSEPMFDYDLPGDSIAQRPLAQRDASRLMVLDRSRGSISHHTFRDLPALLRDGDLLVRNDTRVLPARLFGHREGTGGAWEGLYLGRSPEGLWEFLARSGFRARPGTRIVVREGEFSLIVRDVRDGHTLAEPDPIAPPEEMLARYGSIPLPPYIRRGVADDSDRERYQTVFAENPGSVAAPTAGLHFTPELIDRLSAAGIHSVDVTLHVGMGTFAPIRTADPLAHPIHGEWASVTSGTVDSIERTHRAGGKVIAVGTTTTRALESAALSRSPDGQTGLRAWTGETRLFIAPPWDFRAITGMITNFHLPRTTLLLMVGAFAGVDLLREAYETAVREGYRFYSYGDAMLIV